jgi:hypothetical protein
MSEDTGIHQLADRNEKTRVVGLPDDWPRPLDAHAAFIAAYDRLSGLAGIVQRPAVLVAAVDVRARVCEVVVVEAGHSVIIGRHTQCGLQLPESTIALRHLVVHASAETPGAAPVIRLWDLNTGQPFRTEDGKQNTAVIAEGPLYAVVGPYALLMIPTRGPAGAPWPTQAEAAWRSLPPREFIDRRSPDAARRRTAERRTDGRDYVTNISRVRAEYDGHRTSISSMSPLMILGDEVAPENAWAELRLEWGQWGATYLLSLDQLDRGVLLGRYDRCGVHLSQVNGISRVHLLVIRSGDDILAIDTASTNGIWRGGKKLETVALKNPDLLLLGDTLRVHWTRLA